LKYPKMDTGTGLSAVSWRLPIGQRGGPLACFFPGPNTTRRLLIDEC